MKKLIIEEINQRVQQDVLLHWFYQSKTHTYYGFNNVSLKKKSRKLNTERGIKKKRKEKTNNRRN